MWKKLLILSLSITLLFCITASMTPVDAGGHGHRSIPMNWRVAGPIVQGELVLLKAIGAPGRADLTIMSYGDYDYLGPTPDCEVYKLKVNGINFVAVLDDLSMLFAKLSDDEDADAYLCENPGGTTFKFDMQIRGGAGRFDGAAGYFTAEGTGFSEYFDGGPLSAETGEFKGRIEFDY